VNVFLCSFRKRTNARIIMFLLIKDRKCSRFNADALRCNRSSARNKLDFFQNLQNQNFWKETRSTETERTPAYRSVRTGSTNKKTDPDAFLKTNQQTDPGAFLKKSNVFNLSLAPQQGSLATVVIRISLKIRALK
jgi:hypothetical protein